MIRMNILLKGRQKLCCKNEPYALYRFGEIDRLKQIENKNLLKLWQHTLNNCDMYFYICGNIEKLNPKL